MNIFRRENLWQFFNSQ